MAQNTESNAGLYFIVGALVVAVAVLGFIFMGGEADVAGYEPAAGIERAADNVGDAAQETTSEFNINMDEDGGVSGSTTQRSE